MKEEKDLGKFNKNIFFVILFIVVILDQASKYFVQKITAPINFLGIQITFVENTGAAFGILKDNAFILGVLSIIIAIILIAYVIIYKKSYIVLGLIAGGAIGNGFDRLIRGAVIDFISIGWWPAFNIADSAIVLGIGLILLQEIVTKKPKKNTTKPL